MNPQNDWWVSLNHGGLLIAPNKIQEFSSSELAPLPQWREERLRRELTRFDGGGETLSLLLDFILEDLSGLPSEEWQKAQHVNSRWALSSFTRELIKPRRIWTGPNGEALPVFVPEASTARQPSSRLGVGHSRRLLSRVLEWLRRMQQPLALVTNGRQWRLVHAGQDYDAWSEWDIDLWFEEGRPSAQVFAWRYLINRDVLIAPKAGEPGKLVQAILDSRKGQAELSSVLGERVRQAVEELITASHESIEAAHPQGQSFDYRDLYIAGTRIVMRCIIALFAEARGLLPVDNRIYQQAYSIDGLRQKLDRRAGGRGGERLAQGRSAWPRLVALFNLIYQGSAHEALPIPQYGGGLFRPGRADTDAGMERALALLEAPSNQISDKQVRQILRLLTRTRVRVRQGRRSTWVDGPVDFSALSSEYIGILYEGLLDYELKRAANADPIIFLSVGRQPALSLSRLESLDDKSIKQLFEALKKKDKGPGADDSETAEDTEEATDESVEDDLEVEGEEETEESFEEASTTPSGDEGEIELSADDLERAQAWLERAAEIAGLIKNPRGKSAINETDFANAKRAAGRQLCARLVAPGQFYLIRWGGTRKGAGTFYTRPQLAEPTVRRTLQPLAFIAIRKEVDPRTGLDEVAEWSPRTPEEILDIKVCDPAMGSGSFPVSALRYLTDALVQSLYHHQRIDRRGDGGVARLADGLSAGKISDQLIPLPPDHEAFEETLRAQLKRHIVERCIYGVDIDQLAVELGRMALWVETMDRALPFGFLDHKLKVGNALVGAWFDTFQEYPAMAWEREGGDSNHDGFVHHFDDVTVTRGKKAGQTHQKGDIWTSAIKGRKADVQSQLIDILSGQLRLGEGERIIDVRDELADVLEKLHGLPMHDSEARAQLYQDRVLKNPRYHALKARMDLWCALWFWPGDKIAVAPMPVEFSIPSEEVFQIAKRVAQEQHFFHWELEFPDVFTQSRAGFDGVIGNPPWETMQPTSKEFFSNIDPLYRAYGNQEAKARQKEYFTEDEKIENDWLIYCAHFKAFANWAKCAGQPFGDAIETDDSGRQKHDINLGGRGNRSFLNSERLHDRWRKRREMHTWFSDREHPFRYQGGGKPYLQKMFLEQGHSLLKSLGRLGMIVPSGIYTDHGTTELRELFLTRCDWQWLFGFENRHKIFDIDARFKFCPLVIQKGGQTKAIRAAFMHRDVDDWAQAARYVFSYPRERVQEFSPHSKAILEIRTKKDLEVLQKIYSNSIILGTKGANGWNVRYQQGDFNMASDSQLFPPREKWESKGYRANEYGHWVRGPWRTYSGPKSILNREVGLMLSVDGLSALSVDDIEDVALPLYEGRMIGQFDFSDKGWVRGKGRSAIWRDIPFSKKVIEPQFLIGLSDAREHSFTPTRRLAFMDICSATNARTFYGTVLPRFPSGHSVPLMLNVDRPKVLNAILNSFAIDYALRLRVGGLHLTWNYLEESPAAAPLKGIGADYVEMISTRLNDCAEIFADTWLPLKSLTASWRREWAVSAHERIRLRSMSDAVVAHALGLDAEDYGHLLAECDLPAARIHNNSYLNPKGFWRVDKEKDPELRHTVLSLIAFHDLLDKGLEAFLSQNNGEGWMVPTTLRLADYGLGHDDRAKDHQPVASQLGPRFFDWQINEDVERSWQECEAHAELINRIVPIKPTENREDGDAMEPRPGHQAPLL